ncbi:MAG: alpha-mannosidase [candidate division KSB1 bacterium]|nr:alpha-mannosidase [candidate division KSB1 bacterium]
METVLRFLLELEQHLWSERLTLPRWRMGEGEVSPEQVATLPAGHWREVELPLLWGGYDRTAWFCTKVVIPKTWAGSPAHLYLDVDESLLFVNGGPVQGIDVNHREHVLTPCAQGGEQFALAVEAWAGLTEERHVFRRAELRRVQPEAWELYYDLQVALDVLAGLPEGSSARREVAALVEQTAQLLDPREPGSPAYFAAVKRAGRFFRQAWRRLRTSHAGRVWAFGHAHIDVAWLWRLKEVKRKCARTFATATRLMEEYPGYHFVQSQPQLYAFVKSAYPELYRRIKEKVRAGQWEPTGGMWVEADCNLPSGEALVRQLLYGQRFLEQEFGAPARVLWLPDVFGYSWVLPQLLKKAGIDYFFTAKIGWLYTNPFPYSTFWWQGVDGSRVLAHLCFHRQAYSAGLNAAAVRESWEGFRQKDTCRHVILSYGHGDGGGGPTRAHLEHLVRLQRAPGHPSVRQGSLEQFFAAAEKESGQLPVWADELYLEGHRGTYTTHAVIKRENRKCELLLRDAELLASIAWRLGGAYPFDILRECWERVLRNQFHDILPGSSIPQVYQDALADYAFVREAAGGERERALQSIVAQVDTGAWEDNILVFNTLGWTRSDVVALPAAELPHSVGIEDLAGNLVPCQRLRGVDGQEVVIFVAQDVPACGYRTFRLVKGKGSQSHTSCTVQDTQVDTPHFVAQLNDRGELVRLADKEYGREVLAPGQPGNVLQTFLHYPSFWEAWELAADYENRPLQILRAKRRVQFAVGPVCVVARVTLGSGRSSIVQDIIFYRDLRRIEFDTLVDWHEPRTLLKVAFPLAVTAERAWYEIQFGAISRSTRRNTSWEQARFEVPAQRWADLGDGSYGVSLLNECKYGYDARDNVLRLTLLNNCYAPDPQNCQYGVLYDAPTDEGLHRFSYALYPHAGDWRAAGTVQAAYELNVPLLAVRCGRQTGALPACKSFLSATGAPSVVLDTLKAEEDGQGLILRLYESAGVPAKAHITQELGLVRAWEVDLLERTQRKVIMRQGSARVSLSPFEVLSLKLSDEGLTGR